MNIPKPLPNLGGFALLPPAKGTCQECAVNHRSEEPHNQQSLYYQYYFYGQNGRWPTWSDAMSHCPPEIRDAWIKELAKHGILVGQNPRARPGQLRSSSGPKRKAGGRPAGI